MSAMGMEVPYGTGNVTGLPSEVNNPRKGAVVLTPSGKSRTKRESLIAWSRESSGVVESLEIDPGIVYYAASVLNSFSSFLWLYLDFEGGMRRSVHRHGRCGHLILNVSLASELLPSHRHYHHGQGLTGSG